ncbi:hypothetical protein ScPMuIL_001182 [Solemya velum]
MSSKKLTTEQALRIILSESEDENEEASDYGNDSDFDSEVSDEDSVDLSVNKTNNNNTGVLENDNDRSSDSDDIHGPGQAGGDALQHVRGRGRGRGHGRNVRGNFLPQANQRQWTRDTAGENGYISNAEVYTGRREDAEIIENLGVTGNLVVRMLEPFRDQYYCVFTDRFYTSIERIQNRTLYMQYTAKKKLLEQNAPKQVERYLWHGTSAETVDSINAHGFNRSYCGKNATAYGDGVYFAVNPTYSASNTYSRPDANGYKRCYYACVLTGEFTQGRQGMRVPPPKNQAALHILYDSVTDNISTPGMFIIFNDTQAYPEYLRKENLSDLMQDDDNVLRPADNGSGIVVLDINHRITAVEDELKKHDNIQKTRRRSDC